MHFQWFQYSLKHYYRNINGVFCVFRAVNRVTMLVCSPVTNYMMEEMRRLVKVNILQVMRVSLIRDHHFTSESN